MNKEYAEYLLQKTKDDYNLIAEDFSRTREEIWEEMKFLFDDYLIPLEKVLDLGCGNGRFFEAMKAKNVDYIGVDISEKLIEIAKKRYPKTKFLVANALSLPFPENYFDKAYAIAVFHHIPSGEFRLKFLREAKRILKPGGSLILTVWNWWDFRDIEGIVLIFKFAISKLFKKSKLDFKDVLEPWARKTDLYYHCFTKNELRKLIKEANLKLKEIGVLERPKTKESNIYIIAQK